jgi:23S rRNA pseudouridine2605 synthase
MDLVKHVNARIYPVGRLDWASEGLLLLTNDGELASKLTHASSHVPKTYLVKIAGQASEEDIEKLRRGIRIGAKPVFTPERPKAARSGGPEQRAGRPSSNFQKRFDQVFTAPAQVRLIKEAANPWYEVTLIEGKNRQIRRMFEEIGHHVEKIKRVRFGPLTLNLEPGEVRELTTGELASLRRAARGPSATRNENQHRRDRRNAGTRQGRGGRSH